MIRTETGAHANQARLLVAMSPAPLNAMTPGMNVQRKPAEAKHIIIHAMFVPLYPTRGEASSETVAQNPKLESAYSLTLVSGW